MEYFINYILRIICYTFATASIWLMIKPLIEPSLRYTGRSLDRRIRLRVIKSAQVLQTAKKTTKIYEHLNRYIYLVSKNYEPGSSVIRFLLIVFGTFITSLFVGLMTIGELPNSISFSNPFQDGIVLERSNDGEFFWQIPLLIALIVSTIPYLVLRYRFNKYNVQASYDLLEVAKLLSRHSNYSVYEALKLTADMLSKQNVLKYRLYTLSNVFMSYANENDLKNELRRFDSIIGTTFSTMFCHALLYAEKEGINFLQNSLVHLTANMENQLQTVMESHKLARDPIVLGKYGSLLTLIFVIPFAAFSLGTDVYLKLQFQTKLGLILFAATITSIFISFVISVVLSRPKLDYF